MKNTANQKVQRPSRRKFIISSAAGGGLALGLQLPLGIGKAVAKDLADPKSTPG